MKKNLTKTTLLFLSLILILSAGTVKGQFTSSSDSTFKAGGKLWGYTFGDYFWKAQADSLNRGSGSQYAGVPKNTNAFQLRRVYLGYNYNISKKFSAELLLEAANGSNFSSGSATNASSEGLADGKLAFYIKLANLRIKDIWKGTDLVLGQVSTPGFAMSSEPIWGYRSIEKTIIDWRGTPSYDLGATLQGKFDPKTANFGYDVMLSNGTGAKPENDLNKWLYGDIWGKFFNKKIYVNLYVDYNKLSPVAGMPHSRSMIKGFVAYTTPAFTFGVEGYINSLKNDDQAYTSSSAYDVLSVQAKGISIFLHGDFVKNKLSYFARLDATNPDNKIDNNMYVKYVGNTSGYNDPSTKEQFITAGLDFQPAKNVHLMPNIWINSYTNQGPTPKYNTSDVVARLTFYYRF